MTESFIFLSKLFLYRLETDLFWKPFNNPKTDLYWFGKTRVVRFSTGILCQRGIPRKNGKIGIQEW